MKYDLIVSDYDYTLGTQDGIDSETVSAIKKYIQKGGKFCVCTGRPFQSIRNILYSYDIKEGLTGCLQGSELFDLKTQKEIFSCPIPSNVCVKIIQKMTEDELYISIWTKEALYYKEEGKYSKRYKELNCLPVVKVDDLTELVSREDIKVLKIACDCPDDKIPFLCDEYNGLFGKDAIFNSGAKCVFETVSRFSTKGDNLRKIASYYNIPLSRVIGIGDSTNDIELVKGEWYGIAVGDGKEELKKVAKEITVDFSNRPIKTIIEKYCL